MMEFVVKWAPYFIALMFLGGAIANFIGLRAIKDNFRRWGYPDGWHYVTGAVEVASAILIILPSTRIFGMLLGLLFLIAAAATLVRHREFSQTPASLIFIAIIVLWLAVGGR